MKQAIDVIIFTKDNKIALQQRDNKATIANPGKVTIFAGAVEKGEGIRQAAAREIEEELTLSISEKKLEFWKKVMVNKKDYRGSNYADSFMAYVFVLKNVDPRQLKLREGEKIIYAESNQKELDKINLAEFSRETLIEYLSVSQRKKENDNFRFRSYFFNEENGEMEMNYALGELEFNERIIFPKPFKKLDKNKKQILDRALFNLFLIAGISYYKTYCPRKIDLGEYEINQEQARFWDKLYTKGLAEFFYKNKIDYRGLVKFPYGKDIFLPLVKKNDKRKEKSLVPLGGGKDSIVAMEMLRARKKDFTLMSIRDLKIVRDVARVARKKLLVIERQIEPKLLELNNKKGVYNGHIPFNAYLAFASEAAAILYGYQNVVLANESSANKGNVKYLGETVNHQYSKSLEFEKDFQCYSQKFITPGVRYYSILRKFNELAITKKFVKHKKYFSVFSSCNNNFKLVGKASQRWCGECAKCVFVWTMLSAYLAKDDLIKIFGNNLYEKKELRDTFLLLLGKKGFKPFECVGTPEEMKKAIEMAEKRGWDVGDLMT